MYEYVGILYEANLKLLLSTYYTSIIHIICMNKNCKGSQRVSLIKLLSCVELNSSHNINVIHKAINSHAGSGFICSKKHRKYALENLYIISCDIICRKLKGARAF